MRAMPLLRKISAAALCLTLCAGFCRAVSYKGEDAMRRNTALLNEGRLREATLGFMDMVMQNPGDTAARDLLRRSAEGAIELERGAAGVERGVLLVDAAKVLRELNALDAARKKRTSAWEKKFSKARSLASGEDTVKEAVLSYESLLEEAPVYAGGRARFLSRMEEIRGAFYKTVKGKSPYLVQGRASLDERDLAALFFSQASVNDASDRYVQTGQTQRVLDKSDRLRRLEREVLRHYDSVEKGRYFYVKGRYADAVAAFKEVLFFDPRNEEARFCTLYAEQRLEQGAAALYKR